MTSVLISGIGGSIGIDVARCLRRDPSLRLIGCDSHGQRLRHVAALVDDTRQLPEASADAAGSSTR